jgi:diacylglycerol kinase (ATP)
VPRTPEAPQPGETRSNPFKGKTGVARIAQASLNSIAGLASAWRGESAFRQEVVLAAVMIPVALWVPVSPIERVLLVASVLLVLVVELLNSAIETAIDRISLEIHPLSKRAKDIGSAAVLVALLLCAFVWASILLPVYLRASP